MRDIKVRVKTNQATETVKEMKDEWIVGVKERAQEGKANARMVEVLADYFNLKKSQIILVKGHKSKTKMVRLLS